MWELAPFERKLRPEWAKKQELAVNLAGSARVREKITAKMAEKASSGRKIGGNSPGGGAPKPPFREKITARLAEKASSGRKIEGDSLEFAPESQLRISFTINLPKNDRKNQLF